MLIPNGPAIRSNRCNWDQPQCIYAALRYHPRSWPWRWLGDRLVVEVTDSKHPEQAAHVMSLGAWDRHLRNVHGWLPDDRGEYPLGALRFTEGEVRAFADGVDAGEFYRHFVAAT
jgi:hypothetical protein